MSENHKHILPQIAMHLEVLQLVVVVSYDQAWFAGFQL